MEAAPKVITEILSCRERAVEWWVMEEEHRKKYGLTKDQIDELIILLSQTFPKSGKPD